ncbi:helix-hairpin-helix domain-containing protein [Geomonas sp.]|uniref:helix-hairpin-helix domain-containing protein n=1 Tax=Geomonas sp. TaxID=2651584 RepID=UPI002B45EEA2|nr:helix-hairpin-helix domain-containing protein [Geomonas sp.]HJV36156.1 helix-hairpin-helix domain-containing protein [Geomonas sp.]
MVHSAEDLQQLKGVGRILAKRIYDAGFDSFQKIVDGGEEGLQKVRGLPPRSIATILEQARQLAEGPHAGSEERKEEVRKQVAEVREKVQTLAKSARDRFQEKLAGKTGKKMTADLVRIEDALQQMGADGKKRVKRTTKALSKAGKRVDGLEEASLKKIRKSLKRARKAVLKAV